MAHFENLRTINALRTKALWETGESVWDKNEMEPDFVKRILWILQLEYDMKCT